MKDLILFITVIILMITGVIINSIINCNNNHFIETQKDTVVINVLDSSLMKQNNSLCNIIDSLTNLNIKYEEELKIALFKINRIKEYNRIAGNGNNIKYLRGWINRTLNEN